MVGHAQKISQPRLLVPGSAAGAAALKYVLSFFKAKPSRGNGLVNTVSDYLGPGVGSTPFVVSHRAVGILHQIRPNIWPFWNGRSWLQNATASSHRAWHDLCQRHVQGETGQCQDGSTQLQDTMALTHHALPLHPSWPQLQPANERCADGLLALHQTTVLSHPLGSSILAPASSSIWTPSKWPLEDAVCTGVAPSSSSVVGSSLFAPALSSNATASLLPYSAAQNKGVTVMFPRLSTSAPASSRSRTGSPCPDSAAQCRGVWQSSPVIFGSLGHRRKCSSATKSLCFAADSIFSSSSASGGQNSNLTSWTLSGAEVKTWSSAISLALSKSFCLNLLTLLVWWSLAKSVQYFFLG